MTGRYFQIIGSVENKAVWDYQGLLGTVFRAIQIPPSAPKCVDEKDAHKKSALLCGFFAPKHWIISKNQKIINRFTKTGSVISKLRFGDANSGKIHVLQGLFVSKNCARDSNPLEVKTHPFLFKLRIQIPGKGPVRVIKFSLALFVRFGGYACFVCRSLVVLVMALS